jgi:signal transduction histidine kinase
MIEAMRSGQAGESQRVVRKLRVWAKQASGRARLRRLNIGPRLTLCFAFIILAMLVGNAVLLWQFHIVRDQTQRLHGVDQALVLVLQAHTNLMSFYERLDALAHSQDTARLVTEAGPLRTALIEDSRRTRNAFRRLPAAVQLDPTVQPTLEAIQSALPAQLEAITILATSEDWDAVRLRLAFQVRQLESSMSDLVRNIDREVGEQRAQAVSNIEQAQRRILLTVPITAVVTLLFAAFLGFAVTRSITQPLGRLMEASKALGRGEFHHRIPVIGKDELAHLGRVFNDAAGTLRDHYHIRVEERVAERTRIARDLHDTLLQSFQGLMFRFQAARNMLPHRTEEAIKALDGALEKTERAIVEGRDTVQGLRASTVAASDLAGAIRAIGEELGADQTGQNRSDFCLKVEGASRELAPPLRDEVYRIACEALRNAFRHAHAARIEVELHYDPAQLRLRIRDNGKGIDPNVCGEGGRAGHHGLRGMHERAKLVGGNLVVCSELDAGTDIELSVPALVAYTKSAVASRPS